MRRILVPLLLVSLLGCRAERIATAPAQPEAQPEAQPAPAPAPSALPPSELAWGDKIAWQTWDSAQTLARTQAKSMMVVVYAEWCARCKELAPVFEEPDVAGAAKSLVMVRQDQDQPAPWLKDQLGAYGTYVPRVMFVTPDGKVRDDLTSGHPRYPHFYAAMVKDQLLANMRAASAR